MENIDWGSLGFNYMKTDFNARYTCTDGKWSEMEITSDEYITCTCRHPAFTTARLFSRA